MSINRQNTHIIPFGFEYHSPKSLGEAVELLERYGGEAVPLAGGTDLIVKMKQRLMEPKHVVNLKGIEGLDGIEDGPDGMRIGALTKLRTLERSGLIRERLPVLHDAVRALGSVQVRNMATLGGNLCNASPCADTAVALLALDAVAHMAGPEGERSVPLEGFFEGPGLTVLGPGEILTGVQVPKPKPGTGTSFMKIGRTSLDIATVSVAAALTLSDGVVDHCRVALGSVAPTPLRVPNVERFLVGKRLTEDVLNETAEMVSRTIRPITDIRGTAEYRREASKALTVDALTRAAGEAGGQ